MRAFCAEAGVTQRDLRALYVRYKVAIASTAHPSVFENG